jgi:WD40 repeat protein
MYANFRLALLSVLSLLFTRTILASDWGTLFSKPLPTQASCIAYSPDDAVIATGHAGGNLMIWDAKTGEPIKTLKTQYKGINAVRFFPDGDTVMLLTDEQKAFHWSIKDSKVIAAIDDISFAIALSPDGKLLAGMDPKQAIYLWETSSGQKIKQVSPPGGGGTHNIGFSSDGKYLISAFVVGGNRSALVYEIATGKTIPLNESGGKSSSELKILSSGEKAVISGKFVNDDAPVRIAYASKNGSLVIAIRFWYGKDVTHDIWDLATLTRIAQIRTKDTTGNADITFDNASLATQDKDIITIWALDKGKKVVTLKGDGPFAFAHAGKNIAVADSSNLTSYACK